MKILAYELGYNVRCSAGRAEVDRTLKIEAIPAGTSSR
jgi:hypothetical protein